MAQGGVLGDGNGQGIDLSTESLNNSSRIGRNPFQSKRDLHKRQNNVIRILTVLAYIISVSSMALTLSGYYIFFWTPNPSKPDSHSMGYHHHYGHR